MDNENDIVKFFTSVHEAHLSDTEHAVLRRTIAAYLSEHPVHARSFWQKFRLISTERALWARPLPIALAVLVLAIIGGGVSFAAEGSLPGSILYPVKLAINEPIQGALAITPHAKAAWVSARALRRLEEAEVLVQQKSFNTSTRHVIATNFQTQAKQAKDQFRKLGEGGNTELAHQLNSSFEATLGKHDRMLASFASASTTNAGEEQEIGELRKSIHQEQSMEDDSVDSLSASSTDEVSHGNGKHADDGKQGSGNDGSETNDHGVSPSSEPSPSNVSNDRSQGNVKGVSTSTPTGPFKIQLQGSSHDGEDHDRTQGGASDD